MIWPMTITKIRQAAPTPIKMLRTGVTLDLLHGLDLSEGLLCFAVLFLLQDEACVEDFSEAASLRGGSMNFTST
jgi:hypothetical protein